MYEELFLLANCWCVNGWSQLQILHFRNLLLVLLHGSLGQLTALHLDGNTGLSSSKTLVAQQFGVYTLGASVSVALWLLDACTTMAAGAMQNASNNIARKENQRKNLPLRWAL